PSPSRPSPCEPSLTLSLNQNRSGPSPSRPLAKPTLGNHPRTTHVGGTLCPWCVTNFRTHSSGSRPNHIPPPWFSSVPNQNVGGDSSRGRIDFSLPFNFPFSLRHKSGCDTGTASQLISLQITTLT
ncbi:hypothetical protein CR513_53373, partial [Mucuna pruriens]